VLAVDWSEWGSPSTNKWALSPPQCDRWSKDLTTALSIFGIWCGTDPTTTVRRIESAWSLAPSLQRADQTFSLLDGTPAVPAGSRILHAITPETETTTHQFWNLQVNAVPVFDRKRPAR
jgi:hypothetical protein